MQNLDIFIYTNANPLFVTTQCTDLLLDARLDITLLNKLDVIPDAQQLGKVNPDLGALYADGPEPFGMLPASAYCDRNDFRAVCVNNEYNMAPENEQFIRFAGLDADIIPLPTDTYDISALLWLSDPKCHDPEIADDFPNFFSYHDRFDPLDERFRDAPDEAGRNEVMNQVRKLAGEILKEDFRISENRIPRRIINCKQGKRKKRK